VSAAGVLSLTAAQTAQVQAIVALKANAPDLKVFIAGNLLSRISLVGRVLTFE
jgi:hypothetical protein